MKYLYLFRLGRFVFVGESTIVVSRSDRQIAGKRQGRDKMMIILQTEDLSILAVDYLCMTGVTWRGIPVWSRQGSMPGGKPF